METTVKQAVDTAVAAGEAILKSSIADVFHHSGSATWADLSWFATNGPFLTGTGLDQVLIEIATSKNLSTSLDDRFAAMKSCAAMNTVILASVNFHHYTSIGPSEVVAISDDIRYNSNAYAFWRKAHGNDTGSSETGFHLVEGDGDTAKPALFQSARLINNVFDTIYHLGFGHRTFSTSTGPKEKLINEDGQGNTPIWTASRFLNWFVCGNFADTSREFTDPSHPMNGDGRDNHLEARAGNVVIHGLGGNDVIKGAEGDNSLFGDSGDDTLYGGGGNDAIYGGTGNDLLVGGTGFNMLDGGAGNDQLIGGQDGNSLFGGDGDDVLNGGGGNDWLYGGAGRDVFVFSGKFDQDIIQDNTRDALPAFELGQDKIDLSAYHDIRPVSFASHVTIMASAQGGFDIHVTSEAGGGDIHIVSTTNTLAPTVNDFMFY